jgi:hypothetical protein
MAGSAEEEKKEEAEGEILVLVMPGIAVRRTACFASYVPAIMSFDFALS